MDKFKYLPIVLSICILIAQSKSVKKYLPETNFSRLLILVLILVVFYLLIFELDKLKNDLKNIKTSMFEDKKELRPLKDGDFTNIIINKLKTASVFKVIGDGQQENITDISLEYFNLIQERLNDSTTSFSYQRITKYDLFGEFKLHIEECFNSSSTNSNYFELLCVDNFHLANTYLIIDDELVLINLEIPDSNLSLSNELSFLSFNPEIIKSYHDHFNHILKIECANKIDSHDTLLRILSQREKASSFINSIYVNFNNLRRDSLISKHALMEIKQTHRRLNGLLAGELDIDHTIANGKTFNIFKLYTEELGAGDKYETVSFFEFWSGIMEKDRELFTANKKAIKKGANFHRIFVVNNSWVDYWFNPITKKPISYNGEFLIEILKEHVVLKAEAEKLTVQYNFKVFFCKSEKYVRDYLKNFYDFAILKKDLQTILFLPNHDVTTNSRRFTNTKLYNFFDNKTTSDYQNVLGKLSEIKKELNNQENSAYSNAQRAFLDEIGYFP